MVLVCVILTHLGSSHCSTSGLSSPLTLFLGEPVMEVKPHRLLWPLHCSPRVQFQLVIPVKLFTTRASPTKCLFTGFMNDWKSPESTGLIQGVDTGLNPAFVFFF